MNAKCRICAAAAVLTWTLVGLAGPSQAQKSTPGIAPPNSSAYGKSLGAWMEQYWRWSFATSDNSQPFDAGPVTFMPLPQGVPVSGSGTPDDPVVLQGSLEVTLAPGSPFVLPLMLFYWERYAGWPDAPDDIVPPDAFIRSLVTEHVVTLDGRPILTNFWDYFVSRAYSPPLVYAAPSPWGSVAQLYFHAVGFVAEPLPPGKHTITLHETLVAPLWGWGTTYDNTWIINVIPRGKGK